LDRQQQFKNWRERVAKDMETYTPPMLTKTMEEMKTQGYEEKVSNLFRVYSVKGTGPNVEETEDNCYSNVYTEHHDSVGVDPASPNLKFAVVLIGRQQMRVIPGDIVYCNKIPFEVNEKIRLSKILLCANRFWTVIGRPFVHSASVVATVEEQTKSKKLQRIDWRRRKRIRRRYGHRQHVTRLRIEKVEYEPPKEGSLEPLILKPVRLPSPMRSKTVTSDDRLEPYAAPLPEARKIHYRRGPIPDTDM